MKGEELDWYALSKISEDSPDYDQFAKIIKNVHLKNSINGIPISLKKKLLIIFQNCSIVLHQKHELYNTQKKQLEWKKKIMSNQIQDKKKQLENSLSHINVLKMQVDKKKKMSEKLKRKVQLGKQSKMQQIQGSKIAYLCPFCQRKDFPSKQIFILHAYKDHSVKSSSDQKQKVLSQSQQAANSEIKDLLMSLKDRQYQLMEMMLSKHKQMQTQQLQKAFQFQLLKLKTQPNFHQRKQNSKISYLSQQVYSASQHQSNVQYQDCQLKGQSQYLFYQQNLSKEQIDKNQNQKGQKTMENYDLKRHSDHRTSQGKTKDDYYDIFASQILGISQNQSRFSAHSATFNQPNINEKISHQNMHSQNHRDSRFEMSKNIQRNISWDESHHKRQIPQKGQIINKTYKISHNNNQRSSSKHNSVYINRNNQSKVKSVHIFNSGPLLDDESGASDMQDYFDPQNINMDHQEVQDEQIKSESFQMANQRRKIKGQVNKQSFERINFSNSKSNVMLDYSKDRSSLDISKSKTQQYVDLSNSFSKKHMEYSKDDETINLSDLRLSKLQRQKIMMSKQKKQVKQSQDDEYYNIVLGGSKIDKNSKQYRNTDLLQQFKRPIVLPDKMDMLQQKFEEQQENKFVIFQKQQICSRESKSGNQKQPSVLDQFLRK